MNSTMPHILTAQYQSNLTLVETSEIALPYLTINRPHHVQNVFKYESNQNMFLISTGDILEECDTVHSQPSGVVLEHRHGQLVIYEENAEDNSTLPPNILWQTQPYLDDGGSIRSMFHFGQDCNIIIYSDTVQQRPELLSEESALWQSWTWLNNVDTCSLVWDPLQKKPLVQGGTIENPTRKTTMIENSWEPRNLTATSNELPLILPPWTKVMQGFMIESDPPGYVLQHTAGNLYLYNENPVKNSSSSLLWRTEGAYTYSGNADLTWSMLRNHVLAIRVPHENVLDDAPWLWRTNVWAVENGGDCYDGSCFLTWIAEEERLAIFKGTIDSPVAEIWTSENFVWEPAHTNLSAAKQDAVMILTRFSAALSIVGSGIIIAMILCRWIRQSNTINTRDRLVFCMSFLDFLSSTAHLLNVTLIPRNTYGIRGAIGTEATCTAQGFFIQLGFAVPLYNCMVCVYVLLVVRFKCTKRFISRRVEPVMHFFAWGYALGTGFLGIFLDLYNSNGSFCWVEQYPHDCSDMPFVKCERGENSYFYQWMFAGVTLILAFIVINTSMTWLYCHIRGNKMKMISRFGSAAAGNNRQLNEVGKQALLYVAAFMITFIWPMAIAIQRHYWVATPIFERACLSFFLPLQGFWNFGIFIRPMYNRIRRQNPDRSFFWTVKAAVTREATRQKQTSYGGIGDSFAEDDDHLISNPGLRTSPRRDLDIHLTQLQMEFSADLDKLFRPRRTICRDIDFEHFQRALEKVGRDLENRPMSKSSKDTENHLFAVTSVRGSDNDSVESMISWEVTTADIAVDGDCNSNIGSNTSADEECDNRGSNTKEYEESSSRPPSLYEDASFYLTAKKESGSSDADSYDAELQRVCENQTMNLYT